MVAKARRISGEPQAEHYSNSLWRIALAWDVFVTPSVKSKLLQGSSRAAGANRGYEARCTEARRGLAGEGKLTRHFTWN
jgi:hypothetical protein